MIDIAIDPLTNDIASEDGLVKITSSENEVIQRVRTRLRRVAGEWFLQTTAGVPYFNGEMLGGKNAQYIIMVIRAEIAETQGVTEIKTIGIDYNKDTRKTSIFATIIVSQEQFMITEEI